MTGLSRTQWWIILLTSLAVFLFAAGPMWERPFEIDAHILWSYLVIPVLVAFFLATSKKLRPLPFIIGTVELTLIKFMITISFFAVPAWIAAGSPEKRATPTYGAEHTGRQRPVATPIAPEITGSIHGVVIDADGKPVAGALVFVESGLDDYVFDPPATPVELSNDGHGPKPEIAVLHPFQDLVLRSTDSQLHVMAASDESGNPAFTLPMLAGGKERTLQLPTRRGLFSLRCRVHESGETRGWLLIAPDPFHTSTAEDGTFRLDGIPSAQVVLRAWREPFEGRASLLVRPGANEEATIRSEEKKTK